MSQFNPYKLGEGPCEHKIITVLVPKTLAAQCKACAASRDHTGRWHQPKGPCPEGYGYGALWRDRDLWRDMYIDMRKELLDTVKLSEQAAHVNDALRRENEMLKQAMRMVNSEFEKEKAKALQAPVLLLEGEITQ